MKYRKIKKGNFIERPNRFIAYVNVEGEENNPQIVHVKNTGRCKELLVDFWKNQTIPTERLSMTL